MSDLVVDKVRVCKVCGRSLAETLKNWHINRGKPNGFTCRDCVNARLRVHRAAKRNGGKERTVAQIQAGWGSSLSAQGQKRGEAAGFEPGVRKVRKWRVRRNPALRLEMREGQWMVQLCRGGDWWPATDAEVELWLRLGD